MAGIGGSAGMSGIAGIAGIAGMEGSGGISGMAGIGGIAGTGGSDGRINAWDSQITPTVISSKPRNVRMRPIKSSHVSTVRRCDPICNLQSR